MVSDPPACAALVRDLGASPAGTAPSIPAWLLIEQPGPWPQDILNRVLGQVLPAPRRAQLARLRAEHALRPLLIRRPGRPAPTATGAPRAVLVGAGTPGRRWLAALTTEDLPGLDLDAVAHGPGRLGPPAPGPVFLVCTHGAKDLCCARLGRPVAAALQAEHPGRVWETTHLGGDRWAGNLLVLPDGFLHGQLSPPDARRVAAAARTGRVDLHQLRGRTSASPWAQAAELAVRARTGLGGLDDVLAVHEAPQADPDRGPGACTVTVHAHGQRYGVVVRRRPAGAAGATRCAGILRPEELVIDHLEPLGSQPPPANAIG